MWTGSATSNFRFFREKYRFGLVFRDFGPREWGCKLIFDPRYMLCQSLRSNGRNQGMFRAVFRKNIWVGKHENGEIDLPLLGDSGQTSQDSVVSYLRTSESRDVCPNSSKSGKSISPFLVWLTYIFGGTLWKLWHRLATFRRFRTNVPGILRSISQNLRISGRLS